MSKWRLPTVKELQNIFDYEQGKPEISGFNPYYYWSSTTHAHNVYHAWIVDFGYGNTSYGIKSDAYYVRCVRKNDNGELKWSKSSKYKMNWEEAKEYCKEMNDE